MPQDEFYCKFSRQWVQYGMELPHTTDGVLALNSWNIARIYPVDHSRNVGKGW